MARPTAHETAARRERVEELALQGAGVRVIARVLKSDPRTIAADIAELSRAWAESADLASERHRLLKAAKVAEYGAWTLFESLPNGDANGKLGALGKVLAAQAQGAKVVTDLASADLERRLADLEQRFTDQLAAARSSPPSPLRPH